MAFEIKQDSTKLSKWETINDIFHCKSRAFRHHLMIQDQKYRDDRR